MFRGKKREHERERKNRVLCDVICQCPGSISKDKGPNSEDRFFLKVKSVQTDRRGSFFTVTNDYSY